MQLAHGNDPPITAEEVFFPAGAHSLQGELAYLEEDEVQGLAVIAGPHPFLGGDLENNVVGALALGLAGKGLATLRFNYRGVGKSQGPAIDVAEQLARFWETSHVHDEMEMWSEVQTGYEFLVRATGRRGPLALIGYSFGCALLPHVRPESALTAYVLIAPTISKHPYESFRNIFQPKLVIASEDDFATDDEALDGWFDQLPDPKRLIRQKFDNHFFRGYEPWLVETIHRFLEDQWS